MGNYTLQQAQNDIATLRGQAAHLLAFAEFLQVQVDTSLTIGTAASLTFPGSSSGSTVLSAASDGHLKFSNLIEIADTSAPATPSSGSKLYAATGNLHYVGEDGGDYDTGRQTAFASGQTVSATSMTTLTGMTVPVGSGVLYRFKVLVHLNAAASAGQWQIQVTGPTITSTNYGFRFFSAAGVGGANVNRTALTTALGGPATSVAGAYWAEIEGQVVPSAAGSLTVQGKTTIGADTFDIETGSYIEILPVT
jgi:hypothetical protein